MIIDRDTVTMSKTEFELGLSEFRKAINKALDTKGHILEVIQIALLTTLLIYIVKDYFTSCDYEVNKPISIGMAKRLIDNGIKECDKNICKFVFKIKKVEE